MGGGGQHSQTGALLLPSCQFFAHFPRALIHLWNVTIFALFLFADSDSEILP